MKVFLIGMPGSGKSTLGIQVAKELMMQFVDLDNEIEQHEGKSIPDIFLQDGENHFRQIESRLLVEWATSNRSFIMATGGGAPCFLKGIDVINQHGLSIFLDTPLSELVKRLQSKTDRPLLAAELGEKENILRTMREGRLPCYRKAKVVIENPDLNKLLESIHFKRGIQK
jgi:shikimate kinase